MSVVSISKNLALFLTSILFTFLIAELLLRFTSFGLYSQSHRALFYSAPSFISVGELAVTYQPNSKVRKVAIYGKQIDYDTISTSNNLGFFDNVPYTKAAPGVKGIVFVGDSFTASEGGSKPWIIQLRENVARKDLSLYAMGVSGTGMHNFKSILNQFQNDISIDQINVVSISSDFYRNQWHPYLNEEGMRLCPFGVSKQKCVQGWQPKMYTVGLSESQSDVLTKAQNLYDTRRLTGDASLPFHKKLRIYKLACDGWHSLKKEVSSELLQTCPHLVFYKGREFSRDAAFIHSVGALKAISDEFPDAEVRLFHLPERSETIQGSYATRLDITAKELGIGYISLLEDCNFTNSMYHKHDGHFNDRGYQNLAQCMANYIN